MSKRRPSVRKTESRKGGRFRIGTAGRFVVVFLVLSLIVSILDVHATKHDFGEGYRTLIAKSAAAISNLVTSEVTARGHLIRAGNSALEVSFECTALHETGLFLASVLAMPLAWRRRAVGVVVGFVGVLILNLIRIASLSVISDVSPGLFKIAHDVLMQGFILVMVAPLWIGWAIWATRAKRVAEESA